MTDLPIQLRYIVVHPSLVHPEKDIGIEIIVVLQAIGITTVGIVLLVTVDAERRNAELHPRLVLVDGVAELTDEEVHVIAAPVAFVGESPGITTEQLVVGNGLTGSRIRIEVIVDMQPIHIITTHDVAHHMTDEVTALGNGGIQDILIIILEHPLRMPDGYMTTVELMGGFCLGPVRIDPGMQFHASFMTLRDHPLQRIPIR